MISFFKTFCTIYDLMILLTINPFLGLFMQQIDGDSNGTPEF